MNAENWDQLSGYAETFAAAWDSLDDDQKAEVYNRIASAADGNEMTPGNDEKSEIQRSASYMNKVGNALITAGALLALSPAGVPIATVGSIYKLIASQADKWTPQRCVEFAAWASEKIPAFYGIFCKNPWLLYGPIYLLGGVPGVKQAGPSEGWYLCSACPWSEVAATPDGVMLTPFPDLTLAPNAPLPAYPWTDESSSSSGTGSSSSGTGNALGVALVLWGLSRVL